ncbi:hypothetical protein [Nonomuraea dietziae]|uniref:hypothetical protein n=1 Tax=Nonomuraea dietziae TaxID=65515 RepID=UPI0034465BC2
MQLRIIGTPAEVDTVVAAIESVLDVISVSAPYPCRRDRAAARVRVYVEVASREPH